MPGRCPEQHPMRVQRALGRPGGARGIDHQRGILGRGVDRREVGGRARQLAVKIFCAGCQPVDREHQFEPGHGVARLAELGEPLRVGDQRPRAGILQPIRDRLDPEQHCERQRNGAELVNGDVARGDGRPLRQEDGDAVAAGDAARGEHVGEPVRGLAQRAVAHLLHGAIGGHVEDGGAAGLALRPPVAHVDADIVARRQLPAERAVERVVAARDGKDVGCIHRGAG